MGGLIARIFGSPAVAGMVAVGVAGLISMVALWWHNHNTNLINQGAAMATAKVRRATDAALVKNAGDVAKIMVQDAQAAAKDAIANERLRHCEQQALAAAAAGDEAKAMERYNECLE